MLRVDLYEPGTFPSIDVFLPSCGEDVDVLNNTYRYVARLEWSGELHMHVLDDSDRPEVRTLAHRYGFHYRARVDRGHLKKAGNLKFGYDRTAGDFIVIFDADFCPRADFLRELMPYFSEPDVGIVQSPQYFDVDDSQNWLQNAAGASQEYFYRWVQPGHDRSNGAICVGTNAIYRRAALRRSGGFAQIAHSEDVHTGMNMWKVGYRTRYVPVQLAKGLCPDNLNQLISQQYRWCAGSMSLLSSREFHRIPMPLSQRMCLWSGFLYYISTAVEVFAAPLPPIVVALTEPQTVRPVNSILACVAVTTWFLIHPVMTAGRGKRLGATRAQVVYSFAHAMALWHVIRNRQADWIPTGVRRGSAVSTKTRLAMSIYLTALQLTLWTAIVWRAPDYGWDRYWPMTAFAAASLFIVVPLITGHIKPAPKRPRHRRIPAPAEVPT
jgi:cellulose synthase/poly-beta-1,6-N-acetylglucosamine synthase-like glycosyltransferase